MPKSSADYARQSDPDMNGHFRRRWIETDWPTEHTPARICGRHVLPIDAMVQHSSDRSRHVLTGRVMEGGR
ncbi:hypothetical protein [Muricoccus radiodurans]|uniref:hypothetical protein n=1 Tax=Muricoccus radiodurans TaxID=2231721 RepID=UPI003CF327D4